MIASPIARPIWEGVGRSQPINAAIISHGGVFSLTIETDSTFWASTDLVTTSRPAFAPASVETSACLFSLPICVFAATFGPPPVNKLRGVPLQLVIRSAKRIIPSRFTIDVNPKETCTGSYDNRNETRLRVAWVWQRHEPVGRFVEGDSVQRDYHARPDSPFVDPFRRDPHSCIAPVAP